MPRRIGAIMLLASALFGAGCHKDPAKEPVNKADASVERFLNAWVHNESADQFVGSDKPIRGTDPDWEAGARLQTFLIKDSSAEDGSSGHIRCRVSLVLKDKSGKTVEKEAVYDVELGQPVVITRAKP